MRTSEARGIGFALGLPAAVFAFSYFCTSLACSVNFCRFVTFPVLAAVWYYGTRHFASGGSFKEDTRADGKLVLVTGGNTGIGKLAAVEFAKRGAEVIITSRDKKKGEEAVEFITKAAGSRSNQVHLLILDLTSFAQIKEAGEQYKKQWGDRPLDILINNAGVMACPLSFTKDGLEMQLGTNHFGPFLFTNLLLPYIKQAKAGRIINISSFAHTMAGRNGITLDHNSDPKKYNTMKVYGQSKLANIWFTSHLQKRLKEQGSNVTVYSLHPGSVQSDLTRHYLLGGLVHALLGVFAKTTLDGVQPYLFCGLSNNAAPGGYHCDQEVIRPTRLARDEGKAADFFAVSEKITGVKY